MGRWPKSLKYIYIYILLRGRCEYDETLSNGLSTAECCKISTEVNKWMENCKCLKELNFTFDLLCS